MTHVQSRVPSSQSASLHSAALGRAMRADICQVDRRSNDVDVVQAKLVALCNNIAIHGNEGTSIIVQTVSVTTTLVRIQVHATKLECSFADQFDAAMKLSQLMVTSAGVQDDLCTRKSMRDMW